MTLSWFLVPSFTPSWLFPSLIVNKHFSICIFLKFLWATPVECEIRGSQVVWKSWRAWDTSKITKMPTFTSTFVLQGIKNKDSPSVWKAVWTQERKTKTVEKVKCFISSFSQRDDMKLVAAVEVLKEPICAGSFSVLEFQLKEKTQSLKYFEIYK